MKVNLKTLRTNEKLTQAMAAEKIGISLDYVKAIESGRKSPSLKTIQKIADAFGCKSLDEVLQAS